MALLALWLMLGPPAAAWGAPKVVVTLPPLHSLAAGIMEGAGQPQMLLTGGESPHSASLRPSAARALQNSDIIVWVGPDMETFLKKPLSVLGGKASVLTAVLIPGIYLLETKLDTHEHEKGGEHKHGQFNQHIWLAPKNAILIARTLSRMLIAKDPLNEKLYADNTKRLVEDLLKLDKELLESLKEVKGRPFMVFHDAYTYFTKRYDLNLQGAVSYSPETAPGARRVSEIHREVKEKKIVCLFSEPQFEPALVKTLIEGTSVRSASLDPLGSGLEAGRDMYFRLLRNLAGNMKGCLAG